MAVGAGQRQRQVWGDGDTALCPSALSSALPFAACPRPPGHCLAEVNRIHAKKI